MRQLLQLHGRLVGDPPPPSILEPNLAGVKLISASAALANPRHAVLVFSALTDPNLFAWNSLLQALTLHRLFAHALGYFNLLLLRSPSLLPDEFTFTSVLKACAGLAAVPDGEQSHAVISKRGLESNLFIKNSLVDMYFKFGNPDVARRLFDEMPMRDIVSWNTLIAGFSASGDICAARRVFDQMSEKNMVSWSAMIAGYARSGDLVASRELFDRMPERNVVCWNAMIAGYSQNGKFSEAIERFRAMLLSGRATPNDVTLVSVLSACAHLGALDLGRWIDGFIQRRAIELGLFLGNALADMYAKCGCIADARRVFDKMKERDVISWSIIITGLAMHGHAGEAIAAFNQMLGGHIKPNDVTFMGILSACTHAGMVDAGLEYFHTMKDKYEIVPKVEHYGCIVDLLSRAGRLSEAESMISSMQVPPNVIVWGALLGGCRIHRDIARGERVVQRILEFDPDHSGSYVYLANVYASLGRLDDAAKCRLKMRENRVPKTPGCAWIEVDNRVYEFFMGDKSHPLLEKIYSMIRELKEKMRIAGYVPDTSIVAQNVDEEEKEDAISMHSEKLAVAFGLISTKEGTTIRVAKNLRVCSDCHEAMKFISKIVSREIVLRDRSRFHHFKEGECSCRDYW